jgi:hypothetical protein
MKMSQPVIIDFATLGGPVFTGRTRGESLRTRLHVERLDDASTAVEVKIPDTTYSISSSFILGLFGKSVVKAGSKEAFYEKYHFTSNSMFKSIVDSCVTRALQDKSLLA